MQEIHRDDWPRIEAGIDKSLAEYEHHGFCLSEGDWQKEVSAVALPLVLEGGAEVMTINCGGSGLRLTHEVLVENLGPRLIEVAERIRREFEPARMPR